MSQVTNLAYFYETSRKVRGGREVWVKVDLTAANYADTKVSKAFDPFVKRAEYDEEMAIKAKEAEAKAKAREEKKAKSSK